MLSKDVNSREIRFPSLDWPITGLDQDSLWTVYQAILVRLQSRGLT